MTASCCCADWVGDLARSQASRLAALVRREGIDGADVLDIIQDAFQTLIGRADFEALRDRPDDAARLLAAIARNAARNARRKHHRAKLHEEIEEIDGLASEWVPADAALARAEQTAQLAGCMQRLGDLHRSVVTLRVLEELSGAEAAAQLGLSVGHVAVLLHRARAELESCMVNS
jgi:RNA polymerase sigma-70 factor (ECF subfamily)